MVGSKYHDDTEYLAKDHHVATTNNGSCNNNNFSVTYSCCFEMSILTLVIHVTQSTPTLVTLYGKTLEM